MVTVSQPQEPHHQREGTCTSTIINFNDHQISSLLTIIAVADLGGLQWIIFIETPFITRQNLRSVILRDLSMDQES